MTIIKITNPRGKFEIYQDSNKEFRWKITSSNGRIIGASSEWFSSKSYCIENAELELRWILDFFVQLKKPIPLKPRPILSPNVLKNGKN